MVVIQSHLNHILPKIYVHMYIYDLQNDKNTLLKESHEHSHISMYFSSGTYSLAAELFSKYFNVVICWLHLKIFIQPKSDLNPKNLNFDKFVSRALTGFEIEPKQASSSQADYRKSDHRWHRSQSGISELTSEFENCSKVFLFTFDKL